MITNLPVTNDMIAHAFLTANKGAYDAHKLEAALKNIMTSQSYHANGDVTSYIFYINVHLTVVSAQDKKNFSGKGGGASTPGSNTVFGDIYTDDLDRLFKKTVSFEFNAATAYFSVLFFDGSSNLLGHFQSGALGFMFGMGGGSGSWT